MSEKFTPGPWRTGSLVSYDAADGEPISYVYRREPDDERETAYNRIRVKGGDDCDADAALIAAAPEMYDALRRIPIIRRREPEARDECLGCGAVGETECQGECWVAILEAALAKARGE